MTKKVKIDIVAQDKTRQAIAQSRKNLDGLKKSVFNLRNAFIGLGAGLVIRSLVNTGKEIESLQVRFKFLFGTVEEGNKAFDNLARFAGKVPFSLEEISAASGNLAVVSKDANHLSEILKITGNVAAVTGLDFQTTASQIQRAFSGGIAAADVFREKGVRDMLGFKQGATVSIEDTIKKFEEVFGAGGRFGGATDALAGTFAGTLSMIGDKLFQFRQTINQTFFTELKRVFGDLNKNLEVNKGKIDAIAISIGVGLANAVKAIEDSMGFLSRNADNVARIFSAIIALKMVAVFVSIAKGTLELYRSVVLLATALQISYGNIAAVAAIGVTLGITFTAVNKTVNGLMKGFDELGDSTEFYAHQQEQFRLRQHETIATNEEVSESLNTIALGYTDIGNACQIAGEKVLTFDQLLENATKKQQEAEEKKTADFERNLSNFKDIKFKELDFEELTQEQREKMTKEGFRTALSEGAKHNKAMFRLNQALNIGEAIMNTATGITSALKLGPVGIPLAIAIGAMGAVQIAAIASQQPPAQFGGSRLPNSPFLVGEKGPELFTPNTAGSVTPNHQLGGGGATVNFNITTVDAQSFGNLLDTRRGQIVNMINSALNNKGQAALV